MTWEGAEPSERGLPARGMVRTPPQEPGHGTLRTAVGLKRSLWAIRTWRDLRSRRLGVRRAAKWLVEHHIHVDPHANVIHEERPEGHRHEDEHRERVVEDLRRGRECISERHALRDEVQHARAGLPCARASGLAQQRTALILPFSRIDRLRRALLRLCTAVSITSATSSVRSSGRGSHMSTSHRMKLGGGSLSA